MAIRLSENFVYDVVAHFFVHDVMALNTYSLSTYNKTFSLQPGFADLRKDFPMTPELVTQLARRSFEVCLMLSAPLLVFSLVVGLVISIFQTVTSINEATLAFVPKIVAVMVAMIIFFPWMMSYMSDFTREIFALIPNLRH